LLLTAIWAANPAWAGGSGLNVIVVVNQNSTNSLQLGNDYCEWRGVPPQNMLRMTNWTGGSTNWTPAEFQSELLNPLLAMISTRGLTNQAEFLLLSMDIPYRVTDGSNENSTTAALFYGFKTNTLFSGGPDSCSLPDNSSNSYAYSEMPFSQAPPNTAATNSFLAMMLTDTNLAAAENTLRRGVAADFSQPTQSVYLAKTTDPARNVRFLEFDNAVFETQVAGNYAVTRADTNSTAFTNLFGLQTGLDGFYSFQTNGFVPGALGDNLTSYAGYILDPDNQTPLLAFLEAGASGSYGTVVEPCNWPQKFPDPMDYFYQTRGFSLAEAYYQSVLNPFEGLFVGEPLAAPFAHPASASWSSLTNGTVLSGRPALNPNFAAAAANLPLARADLFVDGTFFQTMTNLPPAANNVLSVILNGFTNQYTVPTNATLASVAAGLAGVLNLQSNVTQVMAIPVGDRIELQSLKVSVPGSNVTVSAGTEIGSAPVLTTWLNAARPGFLDSVATGYQFMTIANAPLVGDWIQVSFTKTNGTVVPLAVTNMVSGATAADMVKSLASLISTNPALDSADGLFLSVSVSDFYDYGAAGVQFYVYANTPGWPASQILATWTTSTNLQAVPAGTNPLADNINDLRPKNHLYLSSGAGSLAINYPLDTTQMSDGWHQLTAVGYEGTSVATQTQVTRTVLVQNTSLSATLAALPAGSNAALGQYLQFMVTANTNNVSQIELFSTGGCQAVVTITNQATANFVLSASSLGLGLHPFYAVVTDQAGHRFQTSTVWCVIPAITLTVTGTPPMIAWPAIPNRQYDVQSTTNPAAGFQTATTITATNSIMQWPITTTNHAGFFRVQVDP
jgi:uncharacterized protein (TIGR03790 family)